MNLPTRGAVLALVTLQPLAAAAAEKTFAVDPFTAVEISTGLNAVIAVGGTQSVVASSPDEDELAELVVEVRDGRLHAYADWDILDLFNFGDDGRQTTITIAVPSLTAVSSNSGADVEVTGLGGDAVRLAVSSGADLTVRAASARRYDIDASSGSDLAIEGTCESAAVNASSGSGIRAERLLCVDVDVNASSGSDIDLHAGGSVEAVASSGADITVYGRPATVTQDTSSGADIRLD